VSDEFDDYEVRWMGEEACERSGATLRDILGDGRKRLPHIMNVLESARRKIPEAKDLELIVRSDEFMGRADAFAKGKDREIFVKQSVLESALEDDDAARYVLLHELNHIIFHPGPRKFRIATGNKTPAFIHKHNSAEWQADRIARAVFMPPEIVDAATSPLDLARTAGVPLTEARNRLADLRAGQPKVLPPDLQRELVAMRASTLRPECFEKQALQSEEKKLRLWNKLPTIDRENPSECRICGKYQITWNEFERTTQCGWFIDDGRIVSSFEMKYGL